MATPTSSMLAAPRGRLVEQRLDLFLLGVGQLLAVTIEELHAVVLGRVVRCGDDAPQVERQECDSRRRKHTRNDRVAADGGDPARERLLQLRPGRARVASDEDPSATGPQCRGTAETLDELRGEVLAYYATDPVRAEVSSRHYRLLNCGALRALCRPAFLRSTIRASRVRKPARLSGTRNSGIGLDERAGDAVTDGACLSARAAAVNADPDVEGPFDPCDLQRRQRGRAVRGARKVVLDRAPVEPGVPVAGSQDHAGDGGLPLARATVLRELTHLSSHFSGCGACGPCGCSGPA